MTSPKMADYRLSLRPPSKSRLYDARWLISIFRGSIQIQWYLPDLSETLMGKMVPNEGSRGLGIFRWEPLGLNG